MEYDADEHCFTLEGTGVYTESPREPAEADRGPRTAGVRDRAVPGDEVRCQDTPSARWAAMSEEGVTERPLPESRGDEYGAEDAGGQGAGAGEPAAESWAEPGLTRRLE